jgi:hypothetical protein
MPYREQWAQCFIQRYRNFGQRVNSPCETAHKDVKSFLLTGQGDLTLLHRALEQMLEKKERAYVEKAASMMQRQKVEYLNRPWLGALATQLTYSAVDLLAKQHRKAAAAMLPINPVPLPPCTGNFTQQMALPCAHRIKEVLDVENEGNGEGIALTKDEIHPRWWLQKPLVPTALNSSVECS